MGIWSRCISWSLCINLFRANDGLLAGVSFENMGVIVAVFQAIWISHVVVQGTLMTEPGSKATIRIIICLLISL